MKNRGNISWLYAIVVLLAGFNTFRMNAQNATDVYENPLDDVRIPYEYTLTKGLTTKVSLLRFAEPPHDQRDYTCIITVNDTLAVRFRAGAFEYHMNDGAAFPGNDCVLDMTLFRMSGSDCELVTRLPFYVDRQSMSAKVWRSYGRESVILTLLPGRYLLKYMGFLENSDFWTPGQDTGVSEDEDGVEEGSEEVAPDDEYDDGGQFPGSRSAALLEDLACHSVISLHLDCLPLIGPERTVTMDWNYISTSVSRDGGAINCMETVEWYDDFGRLCSTHKVAASPEHRSVVDFTEYDAFGNVSRTVLPGNAVPRTYDMPGHVVVRRDVFVHSDTVMAASSLANQNDEAPYSEKVYEDNPLRRPLYEIGPGQDWRAAARKVSYGYLTNASQQDSKLRCRRVNMSRQLNDTVVVIRSSGYYAPGTLRVTSTVDEEGRETLAFVDRLGHNVLTRQIFDCGGANVQYLDTYFIFDGLDRLVSVLPPALSIEFETTDALSQDDIDRYAYLYIYDVLGRLCGKKLPGTGWTLTVSDSADRVVFSQNAEERSKGQVTFRLYDTFGRECVTGSCNRNIAIGEIINGYGRAEYAGLNGTLDGYDCIGISLSDPQVLSALYYDNYDFVTDLPENGLVNACALYGTEIPWTRGHLTGACHHLLSSEIMSSAVWKLLRYDSRGRLARTEVSYPNGGLETEDIGYDFLSNPVAVHRVHDHDMESTPVIEDITYSYDHQSRLLDVYHSLDGSAPMRLRSNTYDHLGRLAETEHGLISDLSSSFSYDVRSHLTSIDGRLFQERLHYNGLRVSELQNSRRRYDGSVSSMEWKAPGDNEMRSYDFLYDGLGRLTSAEYAEGGFGVTGYSTTYSYDYSGNILTLCRYGDISDRQKGMVDNLAMTYDGMRLISASDSAAVPDVAGSADFRDGADMQTEYTYDRCGRLSSDMNAGISSISYNRVGLPAHLTCAGWDESFTYLPDGTKIGRSVSDTTGIVEKEYRGNAVYRDGTLEYLLTDSGLIEFTPSASHYQFHLKDHLGSVRVVATAGGQVAQVLNYYPFGMSYASNRQTSRYEMWPSPRTSGGNAEEEPEEETAEDSVAYITDQPYRFSGNELYPELGLGLYDFHARLYNPALGRFLSVDPMAEKYYSLTPYNYCGDNPLIYVDPEGKVRRLIINEQKKKITVKADFYYSRFDGASVEAISKAADLINKSRGEVDLHGVTYSVRFKVQTTVVDRTNNVSNEINIIKIVKDESLGYKDGNKIIGATDSNLNRVIKIERKYKSDVLAIAHEMLHALGAANPSDGVSDRHSSRGIMTSTKERQTAELLPENISDIIKKGKDYEDN